MVIGDGNVNGKMRIVDLFGIAADDRAQCEVTHRHRAQIVFPRADVGRFGDLASRTDLRAADFDVGRFQKNRLDRMRGDRNRDHAVDEGGGLAVFLEQIGGLGSLGCKAELQRSGTGEAVLFIEADGNAAFGQ